MNSTTNKEPFVLEYTSSDFIHSTARWEDTDASQTSRFDTELRGRWDENMEKGVFRYTMDHVQTRIIPGSKKYVAQLNDKRATERRKPQEIMSVNQSFNPKLFNFTKIADKEILFCLRNVESEKDGTNGAVNGIQNDKVAERNIVIINISPLEYGHVLIVPDVDACMPQILTESAVKLCLESILLSKHRGFKLGFNSLCAYASVNHLHVHAYYLEQELMLEYCDVETLGKSVYELRAMPCHGFGFQLHGSSLKHICRLVQQIAAYFQEYEIAHNMFVTRGTVFGEPQSSTKRTVRIFLWARKKFIGSKVPDEFNVAVIELGGHLPVKDKESYESLTEETADHIIAGASVPAEEYRQIRENVIQIAHRVWEENL